MSTLPCNTRSISGSLFMVLSKALACLILNPSALFRMRMCKTLDPSRHRQGVTRALISCLNCSVSPDNARSRLFCCRREAPTGRNICRPSGTEGHCFVGSPGLQQLLESLSANSTSLSVVSHLRRIQSLRERTSSLLLLNLDTEYLGKWVGHNFGGLHQMCP